jgi:hypothetical protein
MKSFPLALSILMGCSAMCQKKDDQKIEKYYDYQWHLTDVAHARFYSLIRHTDSGWVRQDIFLHEPSTLQMAGVYEDSACTVRNGIFTYAYPNRKYEMVGRHAHNKRTGTWISWHPNGYMADSTTYDDGDPVGLSLSWHANGYVSDSSVLSKDGSGVRVGWFDNGSPSYAGRLSAGRKQHGKWNYFHKTGKPSAIELYDNGRLLEKQYYDEEGNAIRDTASRDRKCEFPAGVKGWLKYLDKHLIFPPRYNIVNSDMAVVEVTMTVDEDGTVQDAYVNTPFYPEFDKIALDVIRRSPKWIPAIEHNRRVRSVFRQAVIFSQPE